MPRGRNKKQSTARTNEPRLLATDVNRNFCGSMPARRINSGSVKCRSRESSVNSPDAGEPRPDTEVLVHS